MHEREECAWNLLLVYPDSPVLQAVYADIKREIQSYGKVDSDFAAKCFTQAYHDLWYHKKRGWLSHLIIDMNMQVFDTPITRTMNNPYHTLPGWYKSHKLGNISNFSLRIQSDGRRCETSCKATIKIEHKEDMLFSISINAETIEYHHYVWRVCYDLNFKYHAETNSITWFDNQSSFDNLPPNRHIKALRSFSPDVLKVDYDVDDHKLQVLAFDDITDFKKHCKNNHIVFHKKLLEKWLLDQ